MAEVIREFLALDVARILPHLSEGEVEEIVRFLVAEGVRKEQDLRHLTVSILKAKLSTVDASEVFDEWQKEYGGALRSSASGNAGNAGAGASHSEAGSSGAQPRPNNPVFQDIPVYDDVDSPFIPASVRSAIKEKKRAPVGGQEDMVGRMVDDFREKVPNLERAHFVTLANQLVAQWPDTFADTLPTNGSKSSGLANQLRVKYDNEKRNNGQGRRGRMGPDAEVIAPNIPQANGCLNWNPLLPEDETEETQEQHRIALKNVSELRKRDQDWKLIKTHLEASYHLQRKEFNGKLAEENNKRRGRKRKAGGEQAEVEEEQSVDNPLATAKTHTTRWPILLKPRAMNIHFKKLTGVDFKEKLADYLREEGKVFAEYLAVKGESLAKMRRRMMRYEARGSSAAVLTGLLLMLAIHFKEETRPLMLVEETTEFDEVSLLLMGHDGTPLIVVAGKSFFDVTALFFTIDNEVLTSLSTMADAVVMLFESFFTFNIQYPTNASSVLTFIQRSIAEINPSTGYRCPTSTIQKKANQRVVNLSNKFTEYKQRLDEEDKEN